MARSRLLLCSDFQRMKWLKTSWGVAVAVTVIMLPTGLRPVNLTGWLLAEKKGESSEKILDVATIELTSIELT